MRLPWVLIAGSLLLVTAQAQDSGGPTNPKAQKSYQEGLDWARHHEYSAAIDSFRKANKQDGGQCEQCLYKIIQYGEDTGDFKAAEEAAQQVIAGAKDPRKAALAHLVLATVKLREALTRNKPEAYTAADREFQAGLSVVPDNPDGNFYDGMTLARLNQDEAARGRFEHYLAVASPNAVMRERAKRYIENPALARARMAPAFSVTTLNGVQVSLDGLAGKVVLIDFWATWCGPCREALPHIRDIAQRFSGEPLVVLSVSLDKDDGAWKSFVAKNGMTWLQVRDAGGDIAKLFNVNAIPHTFTIDADGVLQDEHIGDGSIEGKLKKLCARARQLQEAPQVAQQPGAE